MRTILEKVRRWRTERRSDDARTDGGVATEAGVEPTSDGVGASILSSDAVRSAPFWLPPFLLMAFFVYGAIGWNFLISLTEASGLLLQPDYGTLDFGMYARALGDPGFVTAAKNTVVLMVTFTLFCLAIGLVLALLVDQKIRFENTFRTIYLLPMSLSFVVTAQFWLWMYNFDDGIVNTILRPILGVLGPIVPFLNAQPPQWIGDPTFVMAAVVFALVWQFSGYAMVVYLAALRAIPDAHFEAARVDGASTIRMYWRVIVPQLRTASVSASVILMVFALKAFDFLYSLAGGFQPPTGVDILATKMVRESFSNSRWAYGSAIAIILFAMALTVIGPYLTYQYRRGDL